MAAATSAITSIGSGALAGSAGGPIGAGVGAGVAAIKVGIAELTQHSARLAGAKAENTAIPPAVAAFDADMQAISTAYNAGEINAQTAIQALTALDNNLYQNLSALVGKPGTAWGAPHRSMTDGAGATCNKSCTAACCLYSNNIHPPIVVAIQALNGGTPTIFYQKAGNGFILTVNEVYPPDDSAYGTFTRPSYTLEFAQTATSSVQANILATVSGLTGTNLTGSAAGASAATSGLSSIASSPTILLLVIGVVFLFGAVLLIVRK